MWLGAALATIGSGLLFTLKTDSSHGAVAGYQFIVGFGLGMCTQIHFNAVQYILPPSQMVMGSAIVSFCNSLGPILGTSIGQAIFASLYVRRLELLPGVDGAAVVRAGATNLAAMVPEATLPAVREAYDYALTRAFVLAIACSGSGFACSLVMEQANIKHKR